MIQKYKKYKKKSFLKKSNRNLRRTKSRLRKKKGGVRFKTAVKNFMGLQNAVNKFKSTTEAINFIDTELSKLSKLPELQEGYNLDDLIDIDNSTDVITDTSSNDMAEPDINTFYDEYKKMIPNFYSKNPLLKGAYDRLQCIDIKKFIKYSDIPEKNKLGLIKFYYFYLILGCHKDIKDLLSETYTSRLKIGDKSAISNKYYDGLIYIRKLLKILVVKYNIIRIKDQTFQQTPIDIGYCCIGNCKKKFKSNESWNYFTHNFYTGNGKTFEFKVGLYCTDHPDNTQIDKSTLNYNNLFSEYKLFYTQFIKTPINVENITEANDFLKYTDPAETNFSTFENLVGYIKYLPFKCKHDNYNNNNNNCKKVIN
jgi:hypothetical protein